MIHRHCFATTVAILTLCASLCTAADSPPTATLPANDSSAIEKSGEPLAAGQPATLRVITFNVQFLPNVAAYFNKRNDASYRAQAIGKAVAGFDIIGLNELFDLRHREELLAELRNAWGDSHCHVVTAPKDQYSLVGIDSGLAIVTRFPIVESHSVPYGIGSSVAKYGMKADGLAAKGILHARVAMPNDRLMDVFVTHLESLDSDIKRQQYAILSKTIHRYADGKLPVLLLGDFNTSGDKPERENETSEYANLLKSLNGGRPGASFLDLWPHLHADGGGTSDPGNGNGGSRIDYIFVSENPQNRARLTPIRVDVEPFLNKRTQTLSDHAAVKAELIYQTR
jgi:endonuclease/exonuclease/phosphatase family metal-dependent hydrolase